MSFRSNDFKKLKKEWYQKLRDSGFTDIEDCDSERELLIRWDSVYIINRYTPDSYRAIRHYFVLASQLLHEYDFENEFERKVWSLHADGFSIREIAKIAETKTGKVYKVVKGLRAILLEQNNGRDDDDSK